uniref:Uncharacterized protein n=1 Tax=Amphora coffeiformis TaxID=265554 RepID=A0A7S3L4U6_9STRA
MSLDIDKTIAILTLQEKSKLWYKDRGSVKVFTIVETLQGQHRKAKEAELKAGRELTAFEKEVADSLAAAERKRGIIAKKEPSRSRIRCCDQRREGCNGDCDEVRGGGEEGAPRRN